MPKYIKYKNFYIGVSLIIISFSLNFYVGSHGVYPVDTFVHYDNGFRILLGDDPVKDYWIIHGFLIDYIQAFFFKIFGNNWYSYLVHSSLFNVAITLFSYFVFRFLNVDFYPAFLISISVAFLAYPVSGTPFLDLHSSFFSLFAIYFAIFAILKDKDFYWFFTSVFLCLAFFSKQVPAAYTIIGISLINIYFSINKRRGKIFIFYASGGILFLILLFFFLLLKQIPIKDFILQIFLFPQSIGASRYDIYELHFKNVILDFKFIHLVFLLMLFMNIFQLVKVKKYYNSKNFKIFLIISIFLATTVFHQIYTKNQIYIFFLIPVLAGFTLFYNNLTVTKYKKYITYSILILCLFTTIKYNKRFNIERKFHELNNTTISNSVDAKEIHKNFEGLRWISPYFDNPIEEVDLIKSFLFILRKDENNKMVMSQYNFYSSLLNQKLYSPSRTYDSISYPRKNSKYFEAYQNYLINMVKKNNIKKIYIFEPFSNYNVNERIFNYIPENCFKKIRPNNHFLILETKGCSELK